MKLQDYFLSSIKNRDMLFALSSREVQSRYRGSLLASGWLLLTPFFMLLVYLFVFGTVLQSRWSTGEESQSEFALILFLGLILFNFFSESLNRSTSLIVSNENYVKKVVFPLEIIPLSLIVCNIIQLIISLVVWYIGYYLVFDTVQSTSLYVIPIVLPFVIMVLAITYILSALGVYVRDISQMIALITTGLMFLSPLFFPLEKIPEGFRFIVNFNPITIPINNLRQALYWGGEPNWNQLALYSLIALLLLVLSIWFFDKLRDGFADVL
ncbi:ABC transporter permease [Vibrio sp. ZSDZ65]|uniref:Transport permease protein n=1 Tax=Vibrio qingdaonensis TaxID=2829491 RepID=A0A9X3CRD3_9VIBR|nr:ABC transporter permease [Vibrio qingdaonensis]MCW8348134.1 ABC transporter permease [Vibrio qingdaonensis]